MGVRISGIAVEKPAPGCANAACMLRVGLDELHQILTTIPSQSHLKSKNVSGSVRKYVMPACMLRPKNYVCRHAYTYIYIYKLLTYANIPRGSKAYICITPWGSLCSSSRDMLHAPKGRTKRKSSNKSPLRDANVFGKRRRNCAPKHLRDGLPTDGTKRFPNQALHTREQLQN